MEEQISQLISYRNIATLAMLIGGAIALFGAYKWRSYNTDIAKLRHEIVTEGQGTTNTKIEDAESNISTKIEESQKGIIDAIPKPKTEQQKIEENIKFRITDVPGRTPVENLKRKEFVTNLTSDSDKLNDLLKEISSLSESKFEEFVRAWSDGILNSTQDPIIDIRRNEFIQELHNELITSKNIDISLQKRFSKYIPPRLVAFTYPDVFGAVQKLEESYLTTNIKPYVKNYLEDAISEHLANHISSKDNFVKSVKYLLNKRPEIESLNSEDYDPNNSISVRTIRERRKEFESGQIGPVLASSSHVIIVNSFTIFLIDYGLKKEE